MFAKIIRALISEPFNLSMAEIRQMTVPMIRNVFMHLKRETSEEATPEIMNKLFGKGSR